MEDPSKYSLHLNQIWSKIIWIPIQIEFQVWKIESYVRKCSYKSIHRNIFDTEWEMKLSNFASIIVSLIFFRLFL